jgi:hypothetical protein
MTKLNEKQLTALRLAATYGFVRGGAPGYLVDGAVVTVACSTIVALAKRHLLVLDGETKDHLRASLTPTGRLALAPAPDDDTAATMVLSALTDADRPVHTDDLQASLGSVTHVQLVAVLDALEAAGEVARQESGWSIA